MKNKKQNVKIIFLLMLVMVFLTACSSAKNPESKEEAEAFTEEVAETKVEEKEEVAEVSTPETVEEATVEPETELEGPKSVGEWAQTVDVTEEPKMTIWNDIIKEGIILENGQKYVLREGDLLVICTKEKESGIEINSDIAITDFESRTSSKYVQFKFNKVFLEETLFETVITVAGIQYPFNVTLISENAAADIVANENTEMSGKDWALTLESEEPKLIVWNDETGTKEVIENGGQYKMQDGDMLAIGYPEGHMVLNVTPQDFAKNFVLGSNMSIMEYEIPDESKEINLEGETFDGVDTFDSFNFIITTP